ncbi:hypothetical protein V8F63_08310 [Brevundimonas sp. LF-1]|uniref:hypothetical protein n=1 Tax=Brevundimonas sp. LF-1 TaxID=3126100 RepID=UPI0030E55BBD
MTRAGRIPDEFAGSTRPLAADAHRQLGLKPNRRAFAGTSSGAVKLPKDARVRFSMERNAFSTAIIGRAQRRAALEPTAVGDPTPDPDHPMLRGMITINVDFTNFGQPQRAVFHIRADADKPDAPLRIFRVEHDGWSYP